MTEPSPRSAAAASTGRRSDREDRDIFRLAPSMDADVLEAIAGRLEFRGTDDGYARLSQAYFAQLPLSDARRILSLGCGTGIEVRALKRLVGPTTVIVGIDHSAALVDAARRLSQGGPVRQRHLRRRRRPPHALRRRRVRHRHLAHLDQPHRRSRRGPT